MNNNKQNAGSILMKLGCSIGLLGIGITILVFFVLPILFIFL